MSTKPSINAHLDLPNPYDLEGPWIQIMNGDKKNLLRFAQNVFGADKEGRINLISEDTGDSE
jgi:hypothetical protein